MTKACAYSPSASRRRTRLRRSAASSRASTSTCRRSCRGTGAASICRCSSTARYSIPWERRASGTTGARTRTFASTTTSTAFTTAIPTSWTLSLYGGRGSPLDDVARLAGFPGKVGIRANAVWESYRRGELAAIRNYCEADCVNTYLVSCASSSCAAPRRGALRRGVRARAQHAREAPGAALARIPLALEELILDVESLDAEGRGVARNAEGKVVFVEGALPGERVSCQRVTGKRKFDVARATSVLEASGSRRQPRCPHFGCAAAAPRSMPTAARRWRRSSAGSRTTWSASAKCARDAAADRLRRGMGLPPARAALGAPRASRGGALVGFRERRSSFIAQMNECHVLPPHVSALIPHLKALVEKLSLRARVPQIELAAGDNATALVFRHLEPLTDEDAALLSGFAREHGIHVWVQAGGPTARGRSSRRRASSTTSCRSSACASAFGRPTSRR